MSCSEATDHPWISGLTRWVLWAHLKPKKKERSDCAILFNCHRHTPHLLRSGLIARWCRVAVHPRTPKRVLRGFHSRLAAFLPFTPPLPKHWRVDWVTPVSILILPCYLQKPKGSCCNTTFFLATTTLQPNLSDLPISPPRLRPYLRASSSNLKNGAPCHVRYLESSVPRKRPHPFYVRPIYSKQTWPTKAGEFWCCWHPPPPPRPWITTLTRRCNLRQELLAWLNSLLQLNMTKVEQCGTG